MNFEGEVYKIEKVHDFGKESQILREKFQFFEKIMIFFAKSQKKSKFAKSS